MHPVPRTRARAAMILASLLAPLPGAFALAANEVPQTTPEGMELRTQTQSRVVYAMPGASLDTYTKVALLDCYVAFEKNWERDYNRTAAFQLQIRPDDMERIKKNLADEFRKVFTEVLTEAGHEVVDHTGADVLIIRPALVNLNITAPDVGSASFNTVVVTSAGSMTLYMDLFDSTTGAIFGRVMDAQADPDTFAQRANRVTNRSAADRILRDWARELADHLGAAREDTSADEE